MIEIFEKSSSQSTAGNRPTKDRALYKNVKFYLLQVIKRVRETLCPYNGDGQSSSAGVNKLQPKSAPSDISHLIKRKRKSSESEDTSAPKRVNT